MSAFVKADMESKDRRHTSESEAGTKGPQVTVARITAVQQAIALAEASQPVGVSNDFRRPHSVAPQSIAHSVGHRSEFGL